jgi:hypothetical protein
MADSSTTELSEEIGAYGTGLDNSDSANADHDYEDTFSTDPGHISRAEIRFNAALRAAGMPTSESPSRPVRKPALHTAPAPAPDADTSSTDEWTAFPEPSEGGSSKEAVTVNLYGYGQDPTKAAAAPAPSAARTRLGMSSRAAQKDLLGYFNDLDSQVHDEERKHAREVLHRLGGNGDAQAGMKLTQTHTATHRSRGSQNSIMRLLRKAMESDEFRNEIANMAKSDS